MKNLGKIFFILFLMQMSASASVIASVDSNVVYDGELVTYRLSMSGNEIEKPVLSQICGNNILSTSSQTSIEMINGGYERKYTLSYQFMPQKSCEIAPVEVKVDGNIEKSNSVSFSVKKGEQDLNAEFTLSLDTPKKELYVGEPFELTMLLKQKRDAQAVDSKFDAPDFKGFWVKSETKPVRSDDGAFITTKVIYTLAAQRDGNLTVTPAQLKIASRVNTRDMWGSFSPNLKWRSYFSNELAVDAKPLPNGATIIGDFKITAVADKTEINQNEAVNVTLEVLGSGNLEDIQSFKPYVQNVNVFDEKIVVNKDKLIQKLVFVSDSDFTIPPFELAFFNTKTKRVEKITTKKIDIKVKNAAPKSELKITRDEEQTAVPVEQKETLTQEGNSTLALVIVFIAGVVLGALLMLLQKGKIFTKEKSVNIKDEKVLLVKLLPYKEDAEVANIVEILEKNLYTSTKEVIDKKILKEIVKKYNIS
jgi:hypothetical protein